MHTGPGCVCVPITQSFVVNADSLIVMFVLKTDVHQKLLCTKKLMRRI